MKRSLLRERREAAGLEQMVEALLGNMGSGVQSERVLEALQRILRDPQTAIEYINDPDIGPILRQIQNLINNVEVDEEDDIGGDDVDDIGDRLGNGVCDSPLLFSPFASSVAIGVATGDDACNLSDYC